MRIRNMTQGRPLGLMMSVALPLMLGNVCQQLYTVVDTAIVGNVLGAQALAALGASDWFNWLFLGVVQGFAQGFAIPMAQAFGAKDESRLRRLVGQSAILSVLLGALCTLIALASISPVLSLLQTPEEIRPTAQLYLTVLFSGLGIVMMYNLLAGILRALGDARTPLYAMLLAAFLNIGLDLLFVIPFGWGVAGAAAATLIAQLCSCVYCLITLMKLRFVRPSRSDLRLEPALCAHLLRLGLPISLQNAIIAVGGMIVQRIVNRFGVLFIAGYTATNKLYGVLETAAVSYGYAISTYAGQNLGAGEIVRIRQGTRVATLTGVITSAVIAALMLLFGRQMLGLFISGAPEDVETSLRYAMQYLRVMSLLLPVLYILHIYRSALQGLGQTLMPLVSGLVEFAMRSGAALLLPAVVGYWGVFYAEVLAWLGADLILVSSYLLVYRRLQRERRGETQ